MEYAPSGMAIAEMGGDQHGRILRTNDALCRLLGSPASAMRRYSFSDLVHPEDIGTLLRTSAEGGRAELRLGRRDGTYVCGSRCATPWSRTPPTRFLLTHVEDIEERKHRESSSPTAPRTTRSPACRTRRAALPPRLPPLPAPRGPSAGHGRVAGRGVRARSVRGPGGRAQLLRQPPRRRRGHHGQRERARVRPRAGLRRVRRLRPPCAHHRARG